MPKRPSVIKKLDVLFIEIHSEGHLGIYCHEGVDMVECDPSSTDMLVTKDNRMVGALYIPQRLGDHVSRGYGALAKVCAQGRTTNSEAGRIRKSEGPYGRY